MDPERALIKYRKQNYPLKMAIQNLHLNPKQITILSCKLQKNLLIREMAIFLHVFKTKTMKNLFLVSKPGNI